MKMRIKEFADAAGVSVRTLHYYDKIGLLSPASVDKQTGYRFYDETSFLRMQEVLFYRELDFSLKTICEILSSPNYRKEDALTQQKQLLILKKERLEGLISAIDAAMKGDNVMKAFDNSRFEAYKTEVQEKWGETQAYREYSEKTKNHTSGQWQAAADDLDAVFSEFAVCMKSASADSPTAQNLVEKLQNCITRNYYTCTKEILSGLGQMYVADDRFAANINRHGEGTAAFVSEAIQIYCQQK